MNTSFSIRVLPVLVAGILGALMILNAYILIGNALWWQWMFGLVLSVAGGILVAIAIASLLRRPVASAQDEDDVSDTQAEARDGTPPKPTPPARDDSLIAVQPEDAISALPGVGPEYARVAMTFGVVTVGDFIGLDASTRNSLDKALGRAVFERVESIANRVAEQAKH